MPYEMKWNAVKEKPNGLEEFIWFQRIFFFFLNDIYYCVLYQSKQYVTVFFILQIIVSIKCESLLYCLTVWMWRNLRNDTRYCSNSWKLIDFNRYVSCLKYSSAH